MPGAIGALRREALAPAGGLGGQTLAEDTGLTIAVCPPPITMRHECALLGMTANRSAMSTTRMDTQITPFGAALAAPRHTAAGAHIGGCLLAGIVVTDSDEVGVCGSAHAG